MNSRAAWLAPLGVIVGLGIFACGGGDPPAGESEDTGPALTDDGSDGPGMTGSASTGPTSSDGTADDTTTDAPLACDAPLRGLACQPPGPATIGWQLRVDGVEWLDGELLEDCLVIDGIDDGLTSTIAFDCSGDVPQLDIISMNPHHVPELQPGEMVELHAFAGPEDEAVVARYLTVRSAGGLVLAAFDASELSPPPTFDFEPVALEVVPTDCPQQPTECVYKQDAALQLEFDGQTAQLFQGQEAFVGQLTSYRVIAGLVERIHCAPDDCGYSYAEWFVQGLVFRIPEG